MNSETLGLDKIFPINKGDNFMLGPYHFVCMGWENGRIKAMRYERYRLYMYSLSPEVALDPGFKLLSESGQQQ